MLFEFGVNKTLPFYSKPLYRRSYPIALLSMLLREIKRGVDLDLGFDLKGLRGRG